MRPEGQQPLVAEPSNAGIFGTAYSAHSSESAASTLAFKFGGTSLLGAARMLHAAALVVCLHHWSDSLPDALSPLSFALDLTTPSPLGRGLG